ncbi:MAG: polymer-forming cytoskeletal protein [Gammaproteobacteria bacterium]|nr:polymer-forming cytoskeletal protein [Gammaproteobacteria bacterium]
MKRVLPQHDTGDGDSKPEPLRTETSPNRWVLQAPPEVTLPAHATVAGDHESQASVVGESMVIIGELEAAEDLIIAGRLEGSIMHNANRLVIRETGVVKANIATNNLIIEGRVDGDVHGRESVSLSKTAVVTGNIETIRLTIADGAQFNGKVTMDTREQPGTHTSREETL